MFKKAQTIFKITKSDHFCINIIYCTKNMNNIFYFPLSASLLLVLTADPRKNPTTCFRGVGLGITDIQRQTTALIFFVSLLQSCLAAASGGAASEILCLHRRRPTKLPTACNAIKRLLKRFERIKRYAPNDCTKWY